MNTFFKGIIVTFFSFFVLIPPALAAQRDNSTIGESFYAKIQLTYQPGRNGQYNLFSQQFDLEVPLGNSGYSLWGSAYKDQEFDSMYGGVAKNLSEHLSVGLGVGSASWYGERHTAFMPWIYYDDENISGSFTAERYSSDEDPWFYKWYLLKNLNDTFFVGVYGERWSGIGPALSYKLNKNVRIWVAVFTSDMPSEGGSKAILALDWDFP